MITRFKIFEDIDEFDNDPYDEEIWEEIGDTIRITPKIEKYVRKKWWDPIFLDYIGKTSVLKRTVPKRFAKKHLHNVPCFVIDRFPNSPVGVTYIFIPMDCVEKVG